MKWYIMYKVIGYKDETGSDQQLKAGPYSSNEVQYQADDISSYAGVYDVKTSEAVNDDGSPL
jgi:hypothetical protein